MISCDGFGKIQKIYGIKTNESDHFFYYIDHYWSKSTEEFVNKLLKGDVVLGYNNRENNMKRIRMYFSYNKITEDRVNYIENRTQYNLTEYRMLLKNDSEAYIVWYKNCKSLFFN